MIAIVPTYPVRPEWQRAMRGELGQPRVKDPARDFHTARQIRTYGASNFFVAMALAWFPEDCAADLLRAQLVKNSGQHAFANVRGERCSANYYERRELTWRERERREAQARAERGELTSLMRRQAV